MDHDFAFSGFFLQKSEGTADTDYLADGLASCELKDAQGEVVLQKGMDLSPLVKSGWVNWDHLDKLGPEYLIGEPRKAEIVWVEQHPRLSKAREQGLAGLGLYFQSKLFVGRGIEKADAAWAHLINPDRTRPLGWSIQGRSYERDGHRITKSELRHMALTHQPVQRASFADVCKSLTTGMMEPLLLENLDRKMTSVLWGDVAQCGHVHSSGRMHKGRLGAMEHLTKCRGMSMDEGKAFIKAIIRSGIAR